MTTLDRLRPGAKGEIAAVCGADALSQRLCELGLLEGEAVEVVGIAPFGDPIEIRVGASQLSLRLSEAARIQLRPVGDA